MVGQAVGARQGQHAYPSEWADLVLQLHQRAKQSPVVSAYRESAEGKAAQEQQQSPGGWMGPIETKHGEKRADQQQDE
jgi:hypothetical protein